MKCLTIMLFLFEVRPPILALVGTGGTGGAALVFSADKFPFEDSAGWLEGGVDPAYAEFKVEDDF